MGILERIDCGLLYEFWQITGHSVLDSMLKWNNESIIGSL